MNIKTEEIYTTCFHVNNSNHRTTIKKYVEVEKDFASIDMDFAYFSREIIDCEKFEGILDREIDYLEKDKIEKIKTMYAKGGISIGNLVTISIYNNGEFIGCGHRKDLNQKIHISQKESTEGFNKRSIKKGELLILLHCQSVYTDIEINLKMRGGLDGK